MKDLITLGYCSSPHGIKGAATFKSQHELGEDISKGDHVTLFPHNEKSGLPQEGQDYTIKKITYGHKIMVEFNEITNRNQLEEILPFLLKKERPALAEGEYFISDLIGFKVLDYRTKKEVGEVGDVYDNGVQDILSIKGKLEMDLPFIEQFFPIVNPETKIVELIVPDIIEDTEE